MKILTICILCLVLISSISLLMPEEEKEYTPINYEAMVKLGLAPSSEARLPTEKDMFTGLVANYNGIPLGLFESRTFEEGDFGESFVWRLD